MSSQAVNPTITPKSDLSDKIANNLGNGAVPQLTSIVLTVLIISILSYIYFRKVSKMKPNTPPSGFVLIFELLIKAVEKLVVDVMGSKYRHLTIYFLYLISYILIGNGIALIGFEPIAGTLSVTFYLALITFIGIYYLSIKFQKFAFFKKFLINPLELVTQFAPLVSLSFRLFGNILGGTIILTLVWQLTDHLGKKIPIIGSVNLLYGVIAWLLKIYFEIFDTAIQAIIFAVLTIVYGSIAMAEGQHKPQKKKKISPKIMVSENEIEQTYSERYLVDYQ